MTMQKVKIAVVGCGMISDAYLTTMMEKFKILEVAGCCDINEERARTQAQKYGIRALTMDQILADKNIEIVVNLTTPIAHYPVIKQLLLAGKNVYTEKVLAVELDHAAELASIATNNGLYLGAAPDTFLGAAAQTARSIVESGLIGQVTSCTASLSRDGAIFGQPGNFTTQPGGGIGFDVGIYYITALLSILGPITSVSGITKTLVPHRIASTFDHWGTPFEIRCENLMAATMQFAQGTVGTALFDANSIFILPEKPSVILFGTLGAIYLADPNSFGGDVKVILKGNNQPMVMQQSHAFNGECRGLGVAEMAWSLRMGRPHRASKEMAFHALDVLHGIVKSSQTGFAQTISSSFAIPAPLPKGYHGQGAFEFIEEIALAL